MALIRELADGQVSVKGPIITINLRELPAGYCRDQELLLQIPVKIKLRAKSAEALEEGPPEVPEGDGQRTKRLKAEPETEAASLPLACTLSAARMASAAVPPPIRDPLETPTPSSLIRSPTLETPTPILTDQIGAEQASSSGGADPGPGEGVPSAGSAIHEPLLPSATIVVQDSPTHETAAVGARSSRDHVIDPTMPPDDSQQLYDSCGNFIG